MRWIYSISPPFHRCGVSVAPVVDWTLYDTYYTERYMGLLDENKRGYNDSMVFWRLDALRYMNFFYKKPFISQLLS